MSIKTIEFIALAIAVVIGFIAGDIAAKHEKKKRNQKSKDEEEYVQIDETV